MNMQRPRPSETYLLGLLAHIHRDINVIVTSVSVCMLRDNVTVCIMCSFHWPVCRGEWASVHVVVRSQQDLRSTTPVPCCTTGRHADSLPSSRRQGDRRLLVRLLVPPSRDLDRPRRKSPIGPRRRRHGNAVHEDNIRRRDHPAGSSRTWRHSARGSWTSN